MLFIRSLGIGGAERQLLLLARELGEKHDVTVVTFYDDKQYDFIADGETSYKYKTLNKKSRWDMLGFSMRLLKTVIIINPDVIYAFMNTASVFSLLAKIVKPKVKIIWGIRSSNMNLSLYGCIPRVLRWFECRLSSVADLVISNSYAGKNEAITDGYTNKRFIVIPNGIDTSRFSPNLNSRALIRSKYYIPSNCVVIGVVARHDPMKGLEYFLQAAAMHLKSFPKTHFLMIGYGSKDYTNSLRLLGGDLGISKNITWAGKISDVAPFYSAMDIYTSSSIYGEGFSNTIGEAMSCQLPVVVTDVGDARYILGGYGRLVQPRDPKEMAFQWSNLLTLENYELKNLGIQARDWISRKYSIYNMVIATEMALISTRIGDD